MPIMKEPSRLLETVVALAKEAGRAILASYDSEFSVTQKSDQSPLTAADLSSHELSVSGLARLIPQFPVLSEES
ncbi:inositol monophosphatase family protein, partial [Methylococcus sp. S1M]|uniref:inositol monophosphatase family protein n=1 Tax=Methylococcus sp. S1M TaxID=3438966 RepID=UPI003EDA9F5A